MTRAIVLAAIAIAAALLAAAPATAAGVDRAWVSGHGTDAAGCGAPTNPCRSLQYVHDSIIAPGGEIDILDPAGYGSLSITKAVSVVNDGVGVAGVQQSTSALDGIFIDVPLSGAVTLRGLTIDGLGVAADGVYLSEAGKLTLINCVIRHFAHDGVYVQQTSGTLALAVVDTISADNAVNGFDISPQAQGAVLGVIDHSEALSNGGNGVVAWGLNTSANERVYITVANSDVSNNVNAGIYSIGTGTENAVVLVRNDISDYNKYGYYVDADSLMEFSRTEAMYNSATGIDLHSGGIGFTFGDNAIGAVSGALTATPPS